MGAIGEIVKLVNRLLDLVDEGYAMYKRKERERNIDKIKKDPAKAWSDRFGDKS